MYNIQILFFVTVGVEPKLRGVLTNYTTTFPLFLVLAQNLKALLQIECQECTTDDVYIGANQTTWGLPLTIQSLKRIFVDLSDFTINIFIFPLLLVLLRSMDWAVTRSDFTECPLLRTIPIISWSA